MTWLHSHLAFQPGDVESHVVCQWTSNLDQFPAANLTSLEMPPRSTTLLDRVQRRLGIASYDQRRHQALLEEVILRVKPQVVHSHFGQCGWAAARLVRKHGLRHVVSFYGLDLSYLPKADPRWRCRD
jgi:colanic acid/amylovoran biosynthesis glycosyltransferase